MPITISLLNSFSGVAGSVAGFALPNGALLVVVGSIVGASGLILTQIMCRAMNRHLMDILLGKTTMQPGPSLPPRLPKQSSLSKRLLNPRDRPGKKGCAAPKRSRLSPAMAWP